MYAVGENFLGCSSKRYEFCGSSCLPECARLGSRAEGGSEGAPASAVAMISRQRLKSQLVAILTSTQLESFAAIAAQERS